jgi:RNA polymerase sigma-70 factor (ECF subfamily)
MNGENRMPILNLRDFYPWYTHDEFKEIPGDIAAELFADKRYQRTQERVMRRYKVHSLDAEDGTETRASAFYTSDPAVLLDRMETYCRLCQALNSLPELQGRRIDAHFLLGISRKELATIEGVCESSVNESIRRGLRTMRNFLQNPTDMPCQTL